MRVARHRLSCEVASGSAIAVRFRCVANMNTVRDTYKHLEHPEKYDQLGDVAVSVRIVVLWIGLLVAEGGPLAHRAETEDTSRNDGGKVDTADNRRATHSNHAGVVTDDTNDQKQVYNGDEDECSTSEHKDCGPLVAFLVAGLVATGFNEVSLILCRLIIIRVLRWLSIVEGDIVVNNITREAACL